MGTRVTLSCWCSVPIHRWVQLAVWLGSKNRCHSLRPVYVSRMADPEQPLVGLREKYAFWSTLIAKLCELKLLSSLQSTLVFLQDRERLLDQIDVCIYLWSKTAFIFSIYLCCWLFYSWFEYKALVIVVSYFSVWNAFLGFLEHDFEKNPRFRTVINKRNKNSTFHH